jgi:hypothetical protein
MKPSALFEALHALIGQRVPLHIWGACGVGKSQMPNSDAYTGACMSGGSAATQGNESLISTPPLPPCASAICGVAPVPSPPIP